MAVVQVYWSDHASLRSPGTPHVNIALSTGSQQVHGVCHDGDSDSTPFLKAAPATCTWAAVGHLI